MPALATQNQHCLVSMTHSLLWTKIFSFVLFASAFEFLLPIGCSACSVLPVLKRSERTRQICGSGLPNSAVEVLRMASKDV